MSTTTVVFSTSLRPGQVTFFISALVSRKKSRVVNHQSRGLATIELLFSSIGSSVIGRPRGARTPNLRFWRPLLYQLSYWPASAAKACKCHALASNSLPCHPERERRIGVAGDTLI